ncbi:MAG: UbiA family prenyltransferase [Planctomycetota bacterium]|nr:UbiA family prenyltransferase [Planctomycetota bacterium]
MTATLKDWAQLVRVPNTFTSAADALAGMCLGGAFSTFVFQPIAGLLAAVASILLYWGGMVLNDVFDLDEDKKNNRPGPIVRGAIGLPQARFVGSAMLGIGLTLACSAAYTIHGSIYETLSVGILLVAAILGYDGPLKKTPLAPLVMGLCRALNLSLGMAIASGPRLPNLSANLWLLPAAFCLYVMGFTIAARKEFLSVQSRPRLWFGWLTSLIGICLFAWTIWKFPSPSLMQIAQRRGASTQWVFPCIMLLLAVPVFRRAWNSIRTLSGKDLGLAIRTAILNILFIDATLALIYAGPWMGLLIAALVLPTILLGRVFRAT